MFITVFHAVDTYIHNVRIKDEKLNLSKCTHMCVSILEKVKRREYYHSNGATTSLNIIHERPTLRATVERSYGVWGRRGGKGGGGVVSELDLISKPHESGRKTEFTSVNLRRRYSLRSRVTDVFAHFSRKKRGCGLHREFPPDRSSVPTVARSF